MAIHVGLQVVNDTLADNYIRPDESTKAQSKVKEAGKHTFIDKVKVRLVDSQYWAEVTNFGHKYVHGPDHYVRDFDRLLMGGIWAQVDMRFEYDEETKGKHPFWLDKLTPIQLATFDLEEYRRARSEFTALVRGCGQAYALQTVEPVTSRCGTRRVCQARSSGSERDTRARPHAVAPMNCVPEDSRRRSTCTGRTHAPRARADGTQTPASTVAVRAPSPS